MAYNIKKVKGYLVSALVFYTVLVTYFLAQSAWNDDVIVKRHDDGLLSVLYQEERRHIRSFKDVIKTYGGLVPDGGSKENSAGRGHKRRSSRSTHGYEGEGRPQTEDVNSSHGDNATVVSDNGSLWESNRESLPGVENAQVQIGVQKEKDLGQETAIQGSDHMPDTGNIFIEEIVPNFLIVNSSSDNSASEKSFPLDQVKSSNLKQNSPGVVVGSLGNKGEAKNIYKNKLGNKGNINTTSSISGNNGGTVTQYCDKIDAQQPHLCLHERISFAHPRHVNITTNHLSFKPIGDLYIYSAFLDARHRPALIRLMVLGRKGRDGLKRSGYWCAFSLPAALTQRFYWNGRKEPFTVKPDQATQLEYYAASVGHGRNLQFYIMSCAVPDKHLTTLGQFESSHIHLVAGNKTTPLLEAVQERITVDVVNNLGVSWQQTLGKSPLLKNVIKSDSISNGSSGLQNSTGSSLNFGMQEKFRKMTSSFVWNGAVTSHLPSPLNINSIVSCVAPIHSGVGVIQVVEFIELSLLLGIQHIVMYTHHVTDDVRDVLAMYRSRGLVTVLPWTIPNTTQTWANGRDIALNDCLYRTMYRYEFALFHDMDEYFVPRITPDLPSFINFLLSRGALKPNKTSDLVFSSVYFSPPTKSQAQSLMTVRGYSKDVSKFSTLRSVHRTYFDPQHSLRMTRPAKAYRVGAGERKKTIFTISSRYAGVNHYSKCVDSNKRNGSSKENIKGSADPAKNSSNTQADSKQVILCNNTKVDMFLWRLKDLLIRQAKDSIRELNKMTRN